MLEKFIEAPMLKMIERKEGIVRDALDRVLPGWTMEDVRKRCEWIKVKGRPEETLHVDGEPVLEMHPLEFSDCILEGDRYVTRVTQQYRYIGRAAPPQEPPHGD